MNSSLNHVLRAALVVCAVAAAFAFSAAAQMGGGYETNAPLPEVRIDQRLGEQVPLDLKFKDEYGKEVTLGAYFEDKPVILALVYYECPMLCGEVLNGLLDSLKAVPFKPGEEFTVLTVSFDPEEGPDLARLKKDIYVESYGRPGAEEGWHFLTGTEDQIKKLTDSVGFIYQYVPQSGEYAHAAGIMLLTPEGKVARYFYGIEYPPEDLRLSLVETSENRIGSLADQVVLMCYQWDPEAGTYGVVIFRVLRLAGLATVLALAALIGLLLWAERRRKRALEAEDAGAHPAAQH